MLRTSLVQFAKICRKPLSNYLTKRMCSKEVTEYHRPAHHTDDEEEDELVMRYTEMFDRCDLDGWWARRYMTDMAGLDMVPHPLIIQAALRACRRLNDYALAIRFLEMVKHKCGSNVKTIYPWIVSEIGSVLKELNIETPEDLYINAPELYVPSVDEELPPPKYGGGSKPGGTKCQKGYQQHAQSAKKSDETLSTLPSLDEKEPPCSGGHQSDKKSQC